MSSKTDNARGAHAAKVDLRRRVLAAVSPAYVLDVFCGTGKMYRDAWARAASYTGCDARDWTPRDPVRRFVVDNRVLLRAIDLEGFNVFDLDAYGSPWECAAILMHRRRWAAGELGALVLTDGSGMRARFGKLTPGMRAILGAQPMPTGAKAAAVLARALLSSWCTRSRVEALHIWQAHGRGSGLGGQLMEYTAVVFRGLGDQDGSTSR